jgi:prefoldin subunit 5
MAEQTIDWVEYVRKVEATIDLLSKQKTALTAERDDLAAKLERAYTELHDLRIRAGMVQP